MQKIAKSVGIRKHKNKEIQGRWTKEEHQKFIEGLVLYGKNWKKIEDSLGTRSGAQIRSHAQKFFNRLEKEHLKKQSSTKDTVLSSIQSDAESQQENLKTECNPDIQIEMSPPIVSIKMDSILQIDQFQTPPNISNKKEINNFYDYQNTNLNALESTQNLQKSKDTYNNHQFQSKHNAEQFLQAYYSMKTEELEHQSFFNFILQKFNQQITDKDVFQRKMSDLVVMSSRKQSLEQDKSTTRKNSFRLFNESDQGQTCKKLDQLRKFSIEEQRYIKNESINI